MVHDAALLKSTAITVQFRFNPVNRASMYAAVTPNLLVCGFAKYFHLSIGRNLTPSRLKPSDCQSRSDMPVAPSSICKQKNLWLFFEKRAIILQTTANEIYRDLWTRCRSQPHGLSSIISALPSSSARQLSRSLVKATSPSPPPPTGKCHTAHPADHTS